MSLSYIDPISGRLVIIPDAIQSSLQGDDGTSYYTYVGYASDDSGTNFAISPASNLTYIAVLTTDTEIESPAVGDFAGLWVKYLGDDGTNGSDGNDGADAYVYIAYASDDSGTDFTTTFNSSLDYIAILSTDTEIPSPQASNFTGLWKNYKGVPGDGFGFAFLNISATQSSNLAVGNHVEFDSKLGNMGTLATGSGQADGILTLPAGTYKATTSAYVNLSSGGACRFALYDRTGSAQLGGDCVCYRKDYAGDTVYNPRGTTIFTLSAQSDIDFRFVSAYNVSSVNTILTHVLIEEYLGV